jgi:hypothetical protein
MNKQTIIDTISPEIYAIECEDAYWAATQPGEYGRTKIFYQSDTAHNIVDLIWYQENELDDTEKVRLVFDIYRDMPCYTLLLFLTVTHIFGKSIRMASCDTNAAYDYTVSTTG